MAEAKEWMAELGRKWAENVGPLDRLLAPAGAEGLEALAAGPGEHVLDLGCGGGATTVALARAVGPEGQVTAVDISPDMLAVARQRPSPGNVTFIEGDAGRWPFEPARFDALFSRFGCMFFDDPAAAWANLHRALKPAARAVLVVWRAPEHNPWATIPARVVAEVLGPAEPAPPGAPGPFAWADPDYFRPILAAAGFGDIVWEERALVLDIGAEGDDDPVTRAVRFMLTIGPAARRLKGTPPETRAEVARRLAPALAAHVEGGSGSSAPAPERPAHLPAAASASISCSSSP